MPRIIASLPQHVTGAAAVDLARRSIDQFFDVAAALDPEQPCAFVTGPADVATWWWHAACETWVHRADVDRVAGRPITLGADRGADGLQWAALFRQVLSARAGEGSPAAIHCVATDAGEIVDIGDGTPATVVSGLASDLILGLWNRQHGQLDGDTDTVAAWAELKAVSPLD
jgi:uncharacterized protein (TIGR03083 family)